MPRQLFRPSARELNLLLVVGFLALGYALYLRYLVIEQSTIGLPCEAGLRTWLCLTRSVVITLFGYSVFGVTALASWATVAALRYLAATLRAAAGEGRLVPGRPSP